MRDISGDSSLRFGTMTMVCHLERALIHVIPTEVEGSHTMKQRDSSTGLGMTKNVISTERSEWRDLKLTITRHPDNLNELNL